jgi:hypothetical protein
MAIVQPTPLIGGAATPTIGVVEGTKESIMILLLLFLVFGAAGYFTGRLYGRNGIIACVAGFVVVVVGLFLLGGIRFG